MKFVLHNRTYGYGMKHARPERLTTAGALLDAVRELSGVVERSPGVFYRRSRPFLHFHEDGEELFVDIKVDGEWVRNPASRVTEIDEVITLVRSL